MLKTKNKIFLSSVIIMLIMMNLSLVIRYEKFVDAWNRFTLADWLYLYEACKKKSWSKATLKATLYPDWLTPFQEYITND